MNDRPRQSDVDLIVQELRGIREALTALTTAMVCAVEPSRCDDDDDDDDDEKLI